MSSIVINNLTLIHPDGSTLFKNLYASFGNEKTGLVGNNGSGKSTITKIIAGIIQPSDGSVLKDGKVSYLPQDYSSLNQLTLIQVFSLEKKYEAYRRIISGKGTIEDLIILDSEWEIEERIFVSMEKVGVKNIFPGRTFASLSGGEKVRILFASLLIENPSFIILDEPTNHLDFSAREMIYKFVGEWGKGMIVISHDRSLLRQMDRIAELSSIGLKFYGGNYDFYFEMKNIENDAVKKEIRSAETSLKKNIEEKKQVISRQEKRTKTGTKRAAKSGGPKILLNAKKSRGEGTFKKLKDIHNSRIEESQKSLAKAKAKLRSKRQIKVDLEKSRVPGGKIIVRGKGLNFSWDGMNSLWVKDLNFQLTGAERVLLKGANGSGKTTLMKLIKKELLPQKGELFVGVNKIGTLDQQVSVLDNKLTLLKNLKIHAPNLSEHELRIRLGRFLFYKDEVNKKAEVLSGGERMRAGLACLLAAEQSPELILLDEPTNNLDLESIIELTSALNNYNGALLVVTHNIDFIEEINIRREIKL